MTNELKSLRTFRHVEVPGLRKLEALSEEVWTEGTLDDLEARSIMAYIARLEAALDSIASIKPDIFVNADNVRRALDAVKIAREIRGY